MANKEEASIIIRDNKKATVLLPLSNPFWNQVCPCHGSRSYRPLLYPIL